MRLAKAIALFLFLASFSSASQASLVTWNFSWERATSAAVFSGIGMFSYDSSAGSHVTHGTYGPVIDLDDELTAFSFEGFVNNESVGSTNTLPELFVFSADSEILRTLFAYASFGTGSGIGCHFNSCSLFAEGQWVLPSTERITLAQRDGQTSLSEPGVFGLTMTGMLLSVWHRRRIKIAS